MLREEVTYASKAYVNYLLDKQEYHNEKYTEYDIRQAFEKGAEWAGNHSNSQWISVNDDLPYNHKELIVIENVCTKRVIAFDGDDFSLKSMIMTEGKWYWIHSTKVKYWMPIPNLPK